MNDRVPVFKVMRRIEEEYPLGESATYISASTIKNQSNY